MRRNCTWLAILVALGCTAQSAGPPTLNPNGAAAIDRMFQAAVDQGEIPGVVAAVTNKDSILYLKAFGKQDVARGIPMSNGTVFRIASMTKPVTSVGIMMLYERGKLRLDDPAGNYLPAYKGREVMATFNEKDATYTTRPAKGEMTIRHLLTHTSGLSYPFTSPTVVAIQTKTGKDPVMQRDRQTLTAFGGIAAIFVGSAMLLEDAALTYGPITAIIGGIAAIALAALDRLKQRAATFEGHLGTWASQRASGRRRAIRLRRRPAGDRAVARPGMRRGRRSQPCRRALVAWSSPAGAEPRS